MLRARRGSVGRRRPGPAPPAAPLSAGRSDAGRISVAIVDDYAGIAEAMKRLRVERATRAADKTAGPGQTSLRQSSLFAGLLQRRGIKLPRQLGTAPAG